MNVFEIEGVLSAQLPLRVLGLFAQQDVLPARVSIVCDENVCRVRLEEGSLDETRSNIIAEKLRSMVLVARVDLLGRDDTTGRCQS
jgi:hypothetical protein